MQHDPRSLTTEERPPFDGQLCNLANLVFTQGRMRAPHEGYESMATPHVSAPELLKWEKLDDGFMICIELRDTKALEKEDLKTIVDGNSVVVYSEDCTFFRETYQQELNADRSSRSYKRADNGNIQLTLKLFYVTDTDLQLRWT